MARGGRLYTTLTSPLTECLATGHLHQAVELVEIALTKDAVDDEVAGGTLSARRAAPPRGLHAAIRAAAVCPPEPRGRHQYVAGAPGHLGAPTPIMSAAACAPTQGNTGR